MTQQKVTQGIQTWINPILLTIIGYLAMDKLTIIDERLTRLEQKAEVTIEVKTKVNMLEERINLLRTPAKKEDEIRLR